MNSRARLAAGLAPSVLAMLLARDASADVLPPAAPSAPVSAAPAPAEPPPATSTTPPAPPAPLPYPPVENGADPSPPPAQPAFTAPPAEPPSPEPEPEMSEGRRIVAAYNSGFQWGISPGVGFSNGKAGFLLGVRAGYGIDLGRVILIPGAQLSGYFLDPTVLIGMPVFRVVLPIDRFAPFVEGGVGVGHITTPSQTGAALSIGGGFMIHFTRSFGLGAEVTYQAITGTSFKGIGVGPIIALAF